MTKKTAGYIVRPISGGYQEKGGVNSSSSKVVTRPPAPASMKPVNAMQNVSKPK